MKFFILFLSCSLVVACVSTTKKGYTKPDFNYSQYGHDVYLCAKEMKEKSGAQGAEIRKHYSSGEECLFNKGYSIEEMSHQEYDKRLEATKQYHNSLK